MTSIQINNVSLSAGAVLNGWPMPRRVKLAPGSGDFADRLEGRSRRLERRNVRNAKSSWLNS